jgi:hypothetical protein
MFQVAGYLPSLHTELQKFAVAMEAVIQNNPKTVSLNKTNDHLIQVLGNTKLYSLHTHDFRKQDTLFALTALPEVSVNSTESSHF